MTPEQADRNAENAVTDFFRVANQQVQLPTGTSPIPSPVGRKIKVVGVVTDDDGLPVPGISIGLGAGTEVKTDSEGRFTIDTVVAHQGSRIMGVSFSAEERAELQRLFELGLDDQLRDQGWPTRESDVADVKKDALALFDQVLDSFLTNGRS